MSNSPVRRLRAEYRRREFSRQQACGAIAVARAQGRGGTGDLRPSPAPASSTNGLFETDHDKLEISEARLDSKQLYLDVVHQSVDNRATSYRSEQPVAEMLLDSCPAPAPVVEGSVWRAWPSPSTLTINLADLPDGEIDLTVHAFGQQRTIPLRKVGREVTYLRLEQRAGYRYYPGDAARQIPPTVSLDEVHCALAEVAP